MLIYWSRRKHIYMRKEFNSHRIFLVHQHGRRFIVLEHQYGRRDVMWKHSMSHFRRLVEIHSDVIKGIFGMMWLLVFSEWNEYIWMHEYIIYTHSFAKTLCLEEYNRRHLPIALCSALLSMIAEMSLVKSKWWKDRVYYLKAPSKSSVSFRRWYIFFFKFW